MENEENRGLIHKKASKDQLAGLDSVRLVNSSLELSHYSLSHSWPLRVFLEYSNFGSRNKKQAKGREGKQGSRKGNQDQEASRGILEGNLLHV